MASAPQAVDYGHEKQEVQYIEDAKTPTDPSLDLQKELTLSGVDMKNTHAVKGDDSDGKVNWTLRGKFSAVFLAALYTGMPHDIFFLRAIMLTLHKALRLFSTSLEVHSASSRKISILAVEVHGCQLPTFLLSLLSAPTLDIFRISSGNATLPSSAPSASALAVS